MGELLQGPWADRSAPEGDPLRRAPSTPSHRSEPDPEPAWTVPGVDADEPVELPEPPARSKRAENIAIAALTRHDASEGEVRTKLVHRGLEPEVVEGELQRLRQAGLLDDLEFAKRQVDRLRDRKGLGDSAIRSALRGRLVPQDVIDEALADRAVDRDEAQEHLQTLADDRARRLGALPYDVAERRLTAFLMRKGHAGSAVRDAVHHALDAAGFR